MAGYPLCNLCFLLWWRSPRVWLDTEGRRLRQELCATITCSWRHEHTSSLSAGKRPHVHTHTHTHISMHKACQRKCEQDVCVCRWLGVCVCVLCVCVLCVCVCVCVCCVGLQVSCQERPSLTQEHKRRMSHTTGKKHKHQSTIPHIGWHALAMIRYFSVLLLTLSM